MINNNTISILASYQIQKMYVNSFAANTQLTSRSMKTI